jgi:hypothetical protein
MDVPASTSKDDGIEGPGRTDQEDSQARDNTGITRPEHRDTPVGKILERVELIETSFYAYVHAHQSRLEARLDESKKLESTFTDTLFELKQEIFKMAESQSAQPEE